MIASNEQQVAEAQVSVTSQVKWEQQLDALRAEEADFGKWIIVADRKDVVEQAASDHSVRLTNDDVIEILNEVESDGLDCAIEDAIREWVEAREYDSEEDENADSGE